jgi:hypothetical protein
MAAPLYDIKALQKTLLELQQELPDSPLQIDLQRLQNQLQELQRQAPTVQPTNLIVNPTTPLISLVGHELAVFQTFSRFLGALSHLVPVEHLVNAASNLTIAAYLSGGTPEHHSEHTHHPGHPR